MNHALTSARRIRPEAIAFGAVVSVTAVLLSWVIAASIPGDGEGKAWAMYTWKLLYLPATLALGALSVVGHDLISRARRMPARLVLVLATAAVVAAIPYLATFALSMMK